MAHRVELPVEAAYDRWAASYDSYDNPMVFMARFALAALADDVGGLTIVEFGCGTGRNLAALRDAGAGPLIGLDLSEAMLGRARALGAWELIRHDMSDSVPLPDRSADAALFCLSLEHVGDIAKPIAEAARVLRPGGRAWIIEIHPFLSMQGAKAHFRDGDAEVHMPTFPHRFCDYLEAIDSAGLSIRRCLELRPTDIAGELPAKVLKRGAETPMVVGFELRRATADVRG